ncbi:MAG: putative metal-binding motif-containing protein [Bacteroidetes bacterium]|nr:putative metal-binding motif-containing protein [Bacteroidota bacterium]
MTIPNFNKSRCYRNSNALDDNCNIEIDEALTFNTYCIDADDDSYGNPLIDSIWCSIIIGYVTDNTDCNDKDSFINPGMEEILNGTDDNCNQLIDEGLVSIEESTDQTNFTIFPNPNTGTFYISALSAPLPPLRETNQPCVLEIFNSLPNYLLSTNKHR